MLVERIGSSQLAEASAQGTSFLSRVQPRDLPRLAEIVASGEAPVDKPLEVEVSLRLGAESLPVVEIRVQGTLYLACQRCLTPVAWPLDVEVALTAVACEALAEELADPFDCVLLDDEGGLALRVAVEDEILAVLPIAPLHADPADCSATVAEFREVMEPVARNPNRPFADLGSMMARRDGGEKK